MPPPPSNKKPPASPRAKGASEAPVVYLLSGAEAQRKQAEVLALTRRHVAADWADFDIDSLDGQAATAERILSGAATVPLGGNKRVVLVRDAQQMEPDEQRKLAAGLEKIPLSGVLILHTGTPLVEEGKTKKSSVVLAELVAAVKKRGTVLDFGPPRADDVRAFLLREAQATGKTIAPDALALFSQVAQAGGEDLHRVRGELAKAADHAGNNPVITLEDAEATLSRGPDDVIFKLCDAVGARRTKEALGHVSTLFHGGGRPESVAPRALVLLARQMRFLTQFKYLAEKRLAGRGAAPLPADIATLLPFGDGAASLLANPSRAWQADKYLQQARNFSGRELLDRMEKLLAADLALKGINNSEPPQTVLQRLVIELC